MALTDLLTASDHGIAAAALWALKGGYHQAVLAGDVVLGDTYPAVCGFDPGGAARTITLDGADAADGAVDGLTRVIVNRADAAENLVVQDAASTPNPIGTLNQGEAGVFYHDATDGWVLVAIVSVSLS